MEVLNNQNQKNRQKQDETTEFYNNPNNQRQPMALFTF